MSVKAQHRAAAPSSSQPEHEHERPVPLRASSVLLASHDTEGSRAAERAAFDAVVRDGRLHHLVIVPEFWQSITGDGWRINASTEHEFCDYMEAQIEREIMEHLARVHTAARARGIHYSAGSKHGRLEDCLLAASQEADFDLVIIGAPRPKGRPGLRSRLDLDRLARGLRIPLVVIPHPGTSRTRTR
jgi:nucleotide-binding universal stress UspA family protein